MRFLLGFSLLFLLSLPAQAQENPKPGTTNPTTPQDPPKTDTTKPADPPKTDTAKPEEPKEPKSTGGKTINLSEFKITGQVRKPEAFYILQRSSLSYQEVNQKQSFLGKVVTSVDQGTKF